jgi:hypothetical protein
VVATFRNISFRCHLLRLNLNEALAERQIMLSSIRMAIWPFCHFDIADFFRTSNDFIPFELQTSRRFWQRTRVVTG